MNEINVRTWITWAVILFAVGLLADYFFWHQILGERNLETQQLQAEIQNAADATPSAPPAPLPKGVDNSFITSPSTTEAKPATSGKNNFLESLKQCAPEIAAQAVATPEALVEYLQKSVGVEKEDITVENYHLTMTDGSHRRVHIILADRSNGTTAKELRYFKLDAQGYPERLPTKDTDTLESLLAEGAVSRHEVRSELVLKDGSTVNLEMHDKSAFEFQYNNHGKILSCRYSDCRCP